MKIRFREYSDIILKVGRIEAEGALDCLLASNAKMQRLWSGEGTC